MMVGGIDGGSPVCHNCPIGGFREVSNELWDQSLWVAVYLISQVP